MIYPEIQINYNFLIIIYYDTSYCISGSGRTILQEKSDDERPKEEQ